MKSFAKAYMLAGTAAFVVASVAPLAAQETPAQPGAGAPAQGRQGRGRGGRGGNRPRAGPTPRLPENPLLGVNSGKPDFGGKGMWQVPYIIDMQKQGKTPEGGVIEVPFTAEAKKIFDSRTETHSKDDPEGF